MFKQNVSRNADLPYKVDHTNVEAAKFLTSRLLHTIHQQGRERQVVIVCIGTDRSTGDALGPLVGSKLSGRLQDSRAVVYGTLDTPVHAVNLKDTLHEIENSYRNPYVIAVDACLGQLASVGLVTLGDGPLKPGAGVNKVLPEVGHIHITGIVNVGGFMEYFVLQNTRLSVVMKMADCIADALCESLSQVASYTLPESPSESDATPQKQPFVHRLNNLLGFKS
ncbi:spore protease YyaC [Tumebacillus algifaecis]|uniref:Spore protease YyaC n=1 Tax=Tumebacillus algifaecis TaxID=1214604 RepID=A0A223CWJ2_9BACL|nr:spore protease YyaC [Tumebacillus algifaecis]ASS73567.1 spore protease YyaC [Tumebacillus algifaecis]